MTQPEVVFWAAFSGLAGGFYSFMIVAYDKLNKIPTFEEIEQNIKTQARIKFMAIRIIFAILSSLIFSLWFMDQALSNEISWSKLSFYLCLLSIGTTSLLDISSAFEKLFKKLSATGS
ncbi:hypothetical protein FEV13_03630 [Stutzerimonas degradans]|nr:hypothetical protein FEV13_03630 [Stutzerimonas degradans]